MRVPGAVGDYLLLALRLDRLRPGTVCTWSGDPAARRRVRDEPPPSPSELVRAAGRLAAALPGAGLDPRRERFLAAQVHAVECAARGLAGQAVPFVDEVAAACGVRIELGDTDVYRALHRELDALVPGSGTLAERMAAHRARDRVPAELLLPACAALSGALRHRARAAGLVSGDEDVEYRLVADAPWSALQERRGPGRSTVTVNAGAAPRWARLAPLVAHESYPGHHTEQWRRETVLVGDRGWDEHRVVLAGTPQNLVAEGAADLGLAALVGPGWGRFAADVLATVGPGRHGLGFDGELAERMAPLTAGLARVRQDAALLLHAHRARRVDVREYVRRWLLVDAARAEEVVRFVADRRWRTHTTTYVEGAALVGPWLARDPGPARLARLHDEPRTPAGLRADLSGREPDGYPDATGGVCQAVSGRPLC